MFSPRTLAIFAMLAVAASGPTTVRQAGKHSFGLDVKKTFPLRRRIWDHYDKEARAAPVDKILYYETILDQCWVEVTENNYRVIINVNTNKKDDLRVTLKYASNSMIVEKTVYEEFNDAIRNKKILSKDTFTEVRSLPANSIIPSVTATVTRDGYLVVDIPIDAKAEETALEDREVPVVESEKQLESGKFKSKRPTPMQNFEARLYGKNFLRCEVLTEYFKVETSIEDTGDRVRAILKIVSDKNISKNDLGLMLSDGVLYIFSRIEDKLTGLTNLAYECYFLPQNTVAASITATLTSDYYLVLDIPIDAQTEELAFDHRIVPIVECGKPLEKWKASTAATVSKEVTNNENDNDKVNDNGSDNRNDYDNETESHNDNANENGNQNHNDNANENANENENQNHNDNENENNNDSENKDENHNNNDNENHNDNENKGENHNSNDNENKDENHNNDDNENKDENHNNNDNEIKDDIHNNNDNENEDENIDGKDNANDSESKRTT